QVLQLFCPVARLLEELPAGRTSRLLAPIDHAARQLERESPKRLPPRAQEHDSSRTRNGNHGGETAALQNSVLDPRPARQLHVIHPKGAPRVPVEIILPQRPPAGPHATAFGLRLSAQPV